jgi:hypothetical protein
LDDVTIAPSAPDGIGEAADSVRELRSPFAAGFSQAVSELSDAPAGASEER